MYKVILMPNSVMGIGIDPPHVWEFANGKPIESNNRCLTGFWLECSLPAIPRKDDVIDLHSIPSQEIYEQLQKVFFQSKDFRNVVKKYRDNLIEELGDITVEKALWDFCGCSDNRVDSILVGHWCAECSYFRLNDEYVYVEITHCF